MEPVARIRTEFPGKFGVPRQAGLVPELRGRGGFEPPFRSPEALRGMDGFSHLWLIWEFSENKEAGWSPTVRPPRLGGNQRVGVFATRSPFRPNPIGLSCVKLEGVDLSTPDGPVLFVSGADLVDGTPILDIKPYLPYADCRPEAVGGFAGTAPEPCLAVDFPRPCWSGCRSCGSARRSPPSAMCAAITMSGGTAGATPTGWWGSASRFPPRLWQWPMFMTL